MTTPPQQAHFSIVTQAYERGRRRRAIPFAVVAAALVALTFWVGRTEAMPLLVGLLAAPLAFWAKVKGRPLAEGVTPGLLLGAVPVVAAAVAMPIMRQFGDDACSTVCFSLTLAGGLTVGAMTGFLNRAASGVAVTLGIALLLAPMGCLTMTMGGTFGLIGGAALGLVPVASFRAVRARRA